MTTRLTTIVAAMLIAVTGALSAQAFPTDDAVLRRIWSIARDSSRVEPLVQALTDSIGPRLNGSPGHAASRRWIIERYREWGIPAREERFGTWKGWARGYTHVDLIAPRERTLEGRMLAYSVGTRRPVEGTVAVLPRVGSRAELQRWLGTVRGRFVMVSESPPTCRPASSFERWATPEVRARVGKEQAASRAEWQARIAATGLTTTQLHDTIAGSGAAALLTSYWSGGWGVDRVFGAQTNKAPVVQLSCEDYGLVYRLSDRGQGSRLRLDARSRALGEVPVHNVIAEIRGAELPDEYVMLSAHLDTWDGASGATDNGTGTVVMMEAMRILRAVYPKPRRTILVGHWGGEEEGLNGSRAFVADNPKVVAGLQVLLNQDNGTGRVAQISMEGFTEAGAFFARWMSRLPAEVASSIELALRARPSRGGSDHASFVCAGAPAFRLGSEDFDYRMYTWHTTRDTYDKIVLENVRDNAMLAAMLVYLASEDPERVPRARREMANGAGTAAETWPACRAPRRSSTQPR